MTTQDLISTDVEGQAGPVPVLRAPVWLALAALALGGFGIGTTEFATMGVLPDITRRPGATIPTRRPPGLRLRARRRRRRPGARGRSARGCPARRCCSPAARLRARQRALRARPAFGTLELARFLPGCRTAPTSASPHRRRLARADPERRARAVARVMLGLTVANVVGVPAGDGWASTFGWRSTYWTVTVVRLAARRRRPSSRGSPRCPARAPAASSARCAARRCCSPCSSGPWASAGSSPSTATSPRR